VTTHPTELGARRHLVVSQRLRERRRALNLTQKQVITRLARLGVMSTNKALSSLEHGSGIDVATLPELAAALDCTVTWLLGLTDDPVSWEPNDGGPDPRPVHAQGIRLETGPAAYRPSVPRVIAPIPGEEEP
jgi:transcriptional regulator with XRE-family HTH domain